MGVISFVLAITRKCILIISNEQGKYFWRSIEYHLILATTNLTEQGRRVAKLKNPQIVSFQSLTTPNTGLSLPPKSGGFIHLLPMWKGKYWN